MTVTATVTTTTLRRVVLAVGQLGLGGTEGQLVMLAEGLAEHGIEVQVASLFGSGPRAGDLARHGIPVYHGHFPRLRARPSWDTAAAFPRYVAWLHHQRPQLVHSFLYHAYVVTTPAARMARVPV